MGSVLLTHPMPPYRETLYTRPCCSDGLPLFCANGYRSYRGDCSEIITPGCVPVGDGIYYDKIVVFKMSSLVFGDCKFWNRSV